MVFVVCSVYHDFSFMHKSATSSPNTSRGQESQVQMKPQSIQRLNAESSLDEITWNVV